MSQRRQHSSPTAGPSSSSTRGIKRRAPDSPAAAAAEHPSPKRARFSRPGQGRTLSEEFGPAAGRDGDDEHWNDENVGRSSFRSSDDSGYYEAYPGVGVGEPTKEEIEAGNAAMDVLEGSPGE
ncbi:hypothetical protein AJ79_04309 [Helicocarpus griseus UAMH5409]|uniref:Uncharacterized protein n=1 Tax=Helicocarpus griseus UAMH5409 TaxID=1447875 RepID=A0A2B7XUC2_9EURO|nr:hypothetical protein AJ79_04309 [Helicocarpus griseus UAMH5409]